MKKTILLLIAILGIIACSDSDDDKAKGKFNPPAWIQGTWSRGGTSFRFEANDMCVILPTSEECYNSGRNQQLVTNVKEAITESVYAVSFDSGNSGIYQHFEFRKKSDTQFDSVGESSLQGIFTKR